MSGGVRRHAGRHGDRAAEPGALCLPDDHRARDGALASFKLKHVDLIEGSIFQDAREVRTKAAKTFTTFFVPVDPVCRANFETWVRHLRDDLLFGHDDPLFPPPQMGHPDRRFAVIGFKRACYANAGALRDVSKRAFTDIDLPAFAPHSFRKTLVAWADTHYPTRESFKAFSQNIGHTSVVTTVSACFPVSLERQAELIRQVSQVSESSVFP